MSVFASGLFLLAIFILFLFKGKSSAFIYATCLIPFGTAAVFSLSGLSVLSIQLCFAIFTSVYAAAWIFRSRFKSTLKVELTVAILICLALYAILASFILPRLFQGEIFVFSLDRDAVGSRVSSAYLSVLSPLKPSKGNISQPFYFVLTVAIFVIAVSLGRQKSPEILHKAIVGAALVNITLGTLDLLGGDAILEIFRTANYAYSTDATMLGRARLTGGFPEASGFAGLSVTFFAYFLARFIQTKKINSALLSGISFSLGVLSYSSTFILAATAVVAFLITSGFVRILITKRIAKFHIIIIAVVLLTFAALALLSLITPLGEEIYAVFDSLIFNKSGSSSGLERGHWAVRGLQILFESYGLGIGLGSTRTNGLISVWASNFGILGIILFLAFYYFILVAQSRRILEDSYHQLFKSAQLGLIAMLSTDLVSATTPDPGVLHAILAAICVTAAPARYIVLSWKNTLPNRIA